MVLRLTNAKAESPADCGKAWPLARVGDTPLPVGKRTAPGRWDPMVDRGRGREGGKETRFSARGQRVRGVPKDPCPALSSACLLNALKAQQWAPVPLGF